MQRVRAKFFHLAGPLLRCVRRRGRPFAALALLGGLGLAGCAQQPQQIAAASHSKEYFPSSVYGTASKRVVENGPVPHGGGQYLVGKPYTVAGQTYYPSERKLVQVGNASWYGDAFHGRLTANGEIYDRDSFTAAHPTLPLPSYARVTNLRNNTSMIVRVNDRGPFAANRVMDVSRRVAEALDFRRTGTAKVKVEYVGRASLAGSDDARLYATLRTNSPAQWHESEPTMVAAAQPPARVASLAPIAPAPIVDDASGHRPPARQDERDGTPAETSSIRPRPHGNGAAPTSFRATRAAEHGDRAAPHDRSTLVAREEVVGRSMKRQTASLEHRASARPDPRPLAKTLGRPAMPTVVAQAPLPPSRHADAGAKNAAPLVFVRGKPALRLSRND